MQIIVNPHTLELDKTVDVNSGEYNIQNCQFSFSNEYENLTKMAIFSNEENSYQVIILNNTCIIPLEILQTDGTIGLGVYAYEVDGDNLIKRYSPKPVFFNVELGSYQLANEITPPSPSVVEQILQELETLSNDVSTIQGQIQTINETLPTLATKEEIPTKVSELQNDSNYATVSQIPTKTSDLDNDSGFINKNVNDLTNYTLTSELSPVATSGSYNDLIDKPDLFSGDYNDLTNKPNLSIYATTTQLGNETTARENADIGLQGQIDAITSSSDVKDIVGTYQDLLNYDTQHLGNNDVIKVLQDSTHNDAMTYYRWLKDTSTWQYIGQEGPYYTKSETETLLQNKQNTIDSSNKLNADLVDDINSTNKFVTSSDITNWNNKQNTLTFDNTPTSGSNNPVTSNGIYTYINTIVGDINTALDNINGEVI